MVQCARAQLMRGNKIKQDEGAGGARGGGYAVGDDAFYFEGDRYNDGDTSSGTGTASAGSGAPGSAPRTRTYT